MTDEAFIRDLGDGLILRRARREDAEAVTEMYCAVFRDRESGEPEEGVRGYSMDLLTRPHPTVTLDDYTVVEDSAKGGIVSATVLISQTWSYEGVEFGVGRPEMVATLPDYRGRGLVRAQFRAAHDRSAEKGEMVQAITGIPYFYRQFGYEMTMDLPDWRSGAVGNVPKLKKDQEEPYAVRPATEEDVPFLTQVYAEGQRRWLVSSVRGEREWRLELSGRSDDNSDACLVRVVESAAGEPVGLLAHPHHLWGSNLQLHVYELKPGVSWLAVTPSVLRYLKRTGEEMDAADEKRRFHTFSFHMGEHHPGYLAARGTMPAASSDYCWYLRVPDLPRFLMHIGPVLERRLADSMAVGHTGELKLSFYRTGIKMAFKEGRLEAVEAWQPRADDWGNAAFPGLTFLHLVFGHRTVEELRQTYPDCSARSDEASVLLAALFPKKPSLVWALS